MKSLLILFSAMTIVLCGCASMGGGDLPKQRPDDLVITYNDGGGMLDQSEEYFICKDSCVRDSRFQGHQNRWMCKTDLKKLDDLYAQLVKDDVTSIKTEDQGEVYDRGGISLRFSFGDKNFQIIDAGSSFVVERDQDRFNRTSDAITGFVDECVQSQTISIRLDLQVDVQDSAVQSCSINLDNINVLNWQAQNAEPLAQLRTLEFLPGQYELQGSAQVGQKWVSLNSPIKVSAAKHDFRILLKNDSFEFVEQ